MVAEPNTWRIERNGTTSTAASCAEFGRYTQDSAQSVATHRNPAWQVVLSWGGPVTVTQPGGPSVAGSGVVIAPRIPRAVACPSGATSLWIDPHRIAAPISSLYALEPATVSRLLSAAGGDLDASRLRRVICDIFGEVPSVDARLLRVLALLGTDLDTDALADEAGVSSRRLRQLSAQQLGGPLGMLRRWYRLREALLQLPHHATAAIAARAGFADQAHLIRTCLALSGRTPGSLLNQS
ncbi:helix-turn-helix domain-containing protein [Amycolatopsis pithecellobii]|nr:helix-turn-helix domain-containing protein [Amycolatopsis pithecellobii]